MSDLILFEQSGLMHPGTIVVADNTGMAPQIIDHFRKGNYENVKVMEASIEYLSAFFADSITVATYAPQK